MPLYGHITAECANDAKRHGQTTVLANLKKHIERTQSFIGFGEFLPTPFMKKGLGRSFRLIAYRVPIEGDELILFLRVLARGGSEYEDDFLKHVLTDTPRTTQRFQPLSDDELRRVHAGLSERPPVEPPPAPCEEERAWLYDVLRQSEVSDDTLILETHAWVTRMKDPANRDFLALFHQELEQLDFDLLPPSSSNSDPRMHFVPGRRVGFLYVYRPDLRRLLLIEPLRQPDAGSLLDHHKKELSRIGEGADDLMRVARRSYPHLMILGQEEWLKIQKDADANLALSPEEAELLDSLRVADPDGSFGYPLFINGRAGSGKSTMLQYLAADYIDFALRRDTELLPIYMTCSRNLLERARDTVRSLLATQHARLLEGTHQPAAVDSLLQRSFVVFHEFLYELLPQADRSLFDPKLYVNYAAFRNLWLTDFVRRPEARHLSLDIAWHTIRSYIKGIRSTRDDELGPSEYAALPRRRRTVPVDTYQQVYDLVWSSWYKRLCEVDGYWDDQDLAAQILETDSARSTAFAAVFCDEAQDFTPIELDIIFQLSVYAKRSLQPEELRRVPLVFAGDPLQTINPTGFRWETVQADFHDRFCAILDPRRRARAQFSYKELRFNYRSNPGIVGFCNLIQLVRAALLGRNDVAPQEAWWVDEEVQAVWFAVDNAQTKQQLQQRADLVKIVNCEDGEETAYVQSDSILSTLSEQGDGVYRNVLGPTRAKGLEFPFVVLYRFAETSPPHFDRVLRGERTLDDDPELQLAYEYFFNRLYVAASRAKGQLVVVDSTASLESFWRFATDSELTDRLRSTLKDPKRWSDVVNYLHRGSDAAWSGERSDARAQGAEFALQGRRTRDPYLMRQAALAYRSAGDGVEAMKCLAQAAEYEGKSLDAGDRYRDLGLLIEAFRCYWLGRGFDSISRLPSIDPAFASRLETRAADFMIAGPGAEAALPLLDRVVSAAEDSQWRADAAKDATWSLVLARLCEQLSKAPHTAPMPWKAGFAAFRQLAESGVPLPELHLAVVAYAAADYSSAVAAWERLGLTNRDEYRRAKARLAPFPENLTWFARLGEHHEVLTRWRESRGAAPAIAELDEQVVQAIVDSSLDGGDLTLATEVIGARPDRERVSALLTAVMKHNDNAPILTAALIATRHLIAARSWGAAVRAAEEQDFGPLLKARADLRSAIRRADTDFAIVRAVVEAVATSDVLLDEAPDQKVLVFEFLRRTVAVRGTAPRQHGLGHDVIGAAIERSGKHVDAIQYYESLLRDKPSDEIRQFAGERLVRSHERYAAHLRRQGDEQQAREREVRAKQQRENYGLGARQLPEYPAVRPRDGVLGLSEWARGVFRVVLSRAHGRVRVEQTERFEFVTVHVAEKQLRGDVLHIAEVAPSDGATCAWNISEWSTVIELTTGAHGPSRVRLLSRGDIFDVELGESERR